MRLRPIAKRSFALVLAIFLSCSVVGAQKPDEGIAKARALWENSFNSKDVSGLMSLYSDDAALLPASGERIVGKEKIAAYFKALFDSSSGVHIKLDSDTAVGSADLGYDSGSYEEIATHAAGTVISGNVVVSGNVQISGGGESRQVSNGSYLFVLTRKAGRWLFVQQAWTLHPQPK
jgi:ketosteroid isomerase-like protein